jgi:hypothetical protein
VETDLINMVQNLKSHKHIFGELMTADEILDPPEEQGNENKNENEEYSADTDVVTAIVEEVQCEIAVEKGEVIEVQSDDKDEANEPLSCSSVISLCTQIQMSCLQYGDPQLAFELSENICRYCAQLYKEESKNAKQMMIDDYFGL